MQLLDRGLHTCLRVFIHVLFQSISLHAIRPNLHRFRRCQSPYTCRYDVQPLSHPHEVQTPARYLVFTIWDASLDLEEGKGI